MAVEVTSDLFEALRNAHHSQVVRYDGAMLDHDYRNYFNNGFLLEKSHLDSHSVVRLAGRIGSAMGSSCSAASRMPSTNLPTNRQLRAAGRTLDEV